MAEPLRTLPRVGARPHPSDGGTSPWPPAGRRAAPAAGGGWDLLLACVAVYLATAVGRVHELFPALLVIKPTMVAALLGVCLYLLQQSGPRQVGRLASPTTTCLLGLLVWTALSVPTALNQGVAFRFLTDNFAKTVVMYFVIAGCVRSVRDVERLVLVYFAATVVYTAVVLSRFELGAESWRLGRLYHYDANDLATLIATALPLGLYLALARRHVVARALALGGLAVLAVGLIRSGSRGGFLALLAVAVFVLLRFTTVPARSRVAGLVVILAAVVVAAGDRYWSAMQTLARPRDDYNLTSDAGRLRIWERGLDYLAARPLLGVGAANFPVAEGTISPLAERGSRGLGVRWSAPHNSLVQVGAELGVPGLVFFVGVIAGALIALHRLARVFGGAAPDARRAALLAQTLAASLVGFCVGGFFLSLAYSDMLYTLAALAVGLRKMARGGGPTRAAAERGGR